MSPHHPSSTIAPAGHPRAHRPGFTIIEVLLVFSVIALLTSMLLPALNSARETARAIASGNNLRQWGMAAQQYQMDHRGFLPHEGTAADPSTTPDPGAWYNTLPVFVGLSPYHGNILSPIDMPPSGQAYPKRSVWWCPSARRVRGELGMVDANGRAFDYGFNIVLNGSLSLGPDQSAAQPHLRIDRIPGHSTAVLMGPPAGNVPHLMPSPLALAAERVAARHPAQGGTANIVFLDAHVERVVSDDANTVIGNGSPANLHRSAMDRLNWGVFAD